MSLTAQPLLSEAHQAAGNPPLAITDEGTGATGATAMSQRPNNGWFRGVKRSFDIQVESAAGAEEPDITNDAQEGEHRDAVTPPRRMRTESQNGSQLMAYQEPQTDEYIRTATFSTDEEWFERGLEKLPAELRKTLLDVTDETADWSDPASRGPDQYRSCQEVANAATPQEEPRVEAAAVWAQANFNCVNGTRQFGAAVAFHRQCGAHVFGRYTPPEHGQHGEQLQELQPGVHSPMNFDMMKGLLAGVASVMSENHQKTLTSALDRIATIVRPRLDVTARGRNYFSSTHCLVEIIDMSKSKI